MVTGITLNRLERLIWLKPPGNGVVTGTALSIEHRAFALKPPGDGVVTKTHEKPTGNFANGQATQYGVVNRTWMYDRRWAYLMGQPHWPCLEIDSITLKHVLHQQCLKLYRRFAIEIKGHA